MRPMSNQKGQMTVELVLLSFVFTGLAILVSDKLQANQFIAGLIQSPWTNQISGMIENGVWGSASKTRQFHPGMIERHNSLRGEDAE